MQKTPDLLFHAKICNIFLCLLFTDLLTNIELLENLFLKHTINILKYSNLQLLNMQYLVLRTLDHWAPEWLNRMILHCITHNIVRILQILL